MYVKWDYYKSSCCELATHLGNAFNRQEKTKRAKVLKIKIKKQFAPPKHLKKTSTQNTNLTGQNLI
jgi:hypothetical protein